jgi:hypothetical protein
LDDGKIYRKALYLMVKTMVSCRFSLNQSIDGKYIEHLWEIMMLNGKFLEKYGNYIKLNTMVKQMG